MSNQLAFKAKAREAADEVGEPDAQASGHGFVARAKSKLAVGLVVAGLLATVLWGVLIFWGLLWILF
jgi:hypothetical protein